MDPKNVAIKLVGKLSGVRDVRRSIQVERYSILNDDYDEYLSRAIKDRFGSVTYTSWEIEKYIDKSANVYKYICGLLSVVYLEPPQRTFKKKSDDALYNEVVDVQDLDAAMEQVNLLTTACNECFVRPVLRKNRIDIDIIPPHDVEVESDGPVLTALCYPVKIGEETFYYYWDDESHLVFDERLNIVEEKMHGYGEIPIVTYRRMRPINGFWLGRSGQDLVNCFLDQTIHRSWINRVGHIQSFQQVYREEDEGLGDAIGQTQLNPTFGPDSIPRGKFRTLNLNTDVRKQLEVAEAKLQRTAANWHISSDALNQTTHTSGIARLLSYSSLLEHRRRTIKYYRPVDKKLMHLQCAIWNVDGGGEKFSEDPSPSINYAEPELIATQLDRINLLEKEVSQGVRSPVDYVMRNDPDLESRDDALDVIKRNLDEGRVVQEHRRSFQVPENLDAPQKQAEGEQGGRPENEDGTEEVSQAIEGEENE